MSEDKTADPKADTPAAIEDEALDQANGGGVYGAAKTVISNAYKAASDDVDYWKKKLS
ncbi:MAG: hypothetical protein RIM80_11370 [Alphaproteobacteria bacterium]